MDKPAKEDPAKENPIEKIENMVFDVLDTCLDFLTATYAFSLVHDQSCTKQCVHLQMIEDFQNASRDWLTKQALKTTDITKEDLLDWARRVIFSTIERSVTIRDDYLQAHGSD